MQAALIDILPPQTAPAQDRVTDSGNPSTKVESGSSFSFSSILARALGEEGRPERVEASARSPDSPQAKNAQALSDGQNVPQKAQAPGARGKKMDRLETARTPRNKKTEVESKLEVRGTPGGAEADAVPGAALKKTHLGSELKVEKTKTPAESGEARRKAREPGTDVPSKLAGSPAAAAELSGTMAARALVRAEDSESAAKTAGQPDKRSGDKRNAKVSVVDLRMRPDSQEQNESRNAKSVEASKGSQETSLVGSRPDGSAAASEKTAADSPSLGSSFSDMLSRHLSNAGAQDIVKAAHIVLRDGDTGLIRLRLEPESLGNVKIELKMTEKNITGRIVVTTDEARDAFEKSLAGLRDAFTAGGFETSSLEVSVGGGETGGRGEADDDRDTPFFSGRLRELGDSVPLAAFAGDRGERGVNILA